MLKDRSHDRTVGSRQYTGYATGAEPVKGGEDQRRRFHAAQDGWVEHATRGLVRFVDGEVVLAVEPSSVRVMEATA